MRGKDEVILTGERAAMSENGKAGRRSFWIISRRASGSSEAMVVSFSPSYILPVFSFSEEARLFLWLGDTHDGWKVEEIGAVELAALLTGPYSEASGVALDPLPEMRARSLLSLVSVERDDFVRSLLSSEEERSNGSQYF